MLALFSRILKLSGKYKGRIQGAFVCAFLESILAKMPIFLAFLVLSGFYQKTLTGTKCLYIGIDLIAVVVARRHFTFKDSGCISGTSEILG